MTSDEYRRLVRSMLARRWVRFSLVTYSVSEVRADEAGLINDLIELSP